MSLSNHTIANSILVMYEELKNQNNSVILSPEITDLIGWAKDVLRWGCPYCCNGTVLVDTRTYDNPNRGKEYVLCPHCKGDSRQ